MRVLCPGDASRWQSGTGAGVTGLCVGIDLGGTRIKAGVVENGRVTARSELASDSAAGLGPKLAALGELVDTLAAGRTVHSVGMAMPGIVDRRSRRLTAINAKWSDATEIDFPAWAAAGWGAPLIIENDAVAALAGEWRCGAGAGADGVVMMTLGTGIGVSAVVDGRLLHGSHGQAAIAGHLTVVAGGRQCTCGNRGCAEAEASTSVLPGLARSDRRFATSTLATVDAIDYSHVFQDAEIDPLCRDLRDRALEVWSALAVSLVHAYDPEILIVGGGIAAAGDALFAPLSDYLTHYAWTPWGKVTLRASECGADAAVLGLAAIAEAEIRSSSRPSRKPDDSTMKVSCFI
ncbi:ROK family protein [Cryobacterium sandaracinum]|uniref:ROK family protein n=1 Tax=Cryobacterium sandaracinum TaxID=1259247 RepID=A0ABY2JKH1_9MICO|nr:ROK family protein [Cryobacterium sandaracinum]